jgi:GNAT superfamily N-acetyltransferase
MKGQKLFVRTVISADVPDLSRFYEKEGATPPDLQSGGILAKLVGGIVAHASWVTAGDQLRLDHFYVARELRRKRIGRGLLSEIEKLAAGMHCRAIVADRDCAVRRFLFDAGYVLNNEQIEKRLR